ncbi:helix-turn-helix domain-containing protein [Rhodococcus sp. UFZ-B548]|uniref:helix-turn-helix domain-containing protein n=1 Tax=Rhodococcus sp. UFZ-B548 TaxID=2742212 RepID=UPI001C70C3B2|nr:helix-turn-helix domain-containing protein [Rhodococcus sp. UFZ-B548]
MERQIGRPPPLRVFTTAHFAPDLQVQLWERHNAEALIAQHHDAPTDQPFTALESNLQLGALHLALVRGSRHAVERSAAMAESYPSDSVMIYTALRGEAIFERAGHRRRLHPGHLLVCDADQPFTRVFGHGLEELVVKVPRPVFEATAGIAASSDSVVVNSHSTSHPYARALVRMVGQAVRPREPVPADEASILELAAALVTGERTPLAVAHRAAAKVFIEDHLTDPDLGAVTIATATGISERTLSRVFADSRTSVPRYILARRLDLAYSVLSASAGTRIRTADVAVHCGFGSTAYFSQAFKRRFGADAGDVSRARNCAYSFPPTLGSRVPDSIPFTEYSG